jgi:uncharacterized protein YPO0396
MNSEADVVRLSDLPDPLLEQFRMRRLSVLNWGTFSGLHRMPIAHDGMLLLGPSGAGKSTLLDAISALTVPPRAVRFNAAADESSRKDHDRNLMSYIRGAWADKAQEDSPRSIAKQYLRTGGTWSALALEYANAAGRVITLVRILWVRGVSTSGSVESHFMVIEGAFDLVDIPDFEGERRNIKKKLKRAEINHHEQSFPAYAEHWCRVLGIHDSDALELLHQTQSTKNLSDLNAFLRDFMLAEPPTFGVAKDLITEFVDLDEAHRAVVSARQQVEMLAPARNAFSERASLISQSDEISGLLRSVIPFRSSVHAGLLVDECRRLRGEREFAEAERLQADTAIGDLRPRIEALDAEYAAKGGAHLSSLERQKVDLEGIKQRNQRARNTAEVQARVMGWTLSDKLEGFVDQVQEARRFLDEAELLTKQIDEDREKATVSENRLSEEFKRLQSEIKLLEASPSSIPIPKQQIRTKLCDELGIALARVPFAGELIEVRPEHSEWAGAANRLLGGFGTTLLVHEDDYRKIAGWVDRNYLRDRWNYIVVPTAHAGGGDRTDDRSIVRVLDVQTHSYRSWVTMHLARQFNYERVDTIAELMKGEYRITKAGQIRHGGKRHEKDDRHDISDRRFWVLGDNREKLHRFREDITLIASDLGVATQAKRKAKDDAATLSDRKAAAQSLSNTQWQDIDVASIALRIGHIIEQQRSARSENTSLADLEGRIVKSRQELESETTAKGSAIERTKSASRKLTELELELENVQIEAIALTPAHQASLRSRLADAWSPTLKSFRDDIERAQNDLQREKDNVAKSINAHELSIVKTFTNFLNAWPTERGALQPNLESAPDFFSKLQRIELDGLPAHEERFLNLLRTQSTQRLAELHRHLTEARREIEARLDDVNVALSTVPYNPDSYLRLRVEDLGLDEPREFRRQLAEVFQRQQSAATDDTEAEMQFEALRQLILDLRGDDPDKKRWRDLVLDVRKHVHFIADELERKTDRLIENYSGAGGKSGGQRQKLTATCLAAALRFQLGGVDGGPPSYAAVVLDEAFTKTDNDFTTTCMRIFTELGFQMIVATPVKSVMTLEPFVGGATYVSISNRHTSSMQHIAYVDAEKRLDLPDATLAEALA